ncbi:protein kinase [Kitasatospora sp. NPDC085879]|uniref:protein kinase n=1 Tax=Kitasatospora sp. NPDC085879 TaxID=3154769 RepID=UPI000BB16587|nr:protein kinase [Streptomyces sp. TLI_235]PBC79379.1 protein tyrosine kinase [Streptomyces sp. TLI_235]
MSAAPGQVVAGRYRVTDRPTGAGLPAQDVHTGAPVLLHALDLPELLVPGELYEEPDRRWGTELAELLGRLADRAPRHPRLLVESGAAAEDDQLWVAAERLAGASLDELADTGPVPAYRVAELAADLAGALRALHEADLVHGNVTADAVLVCEDGAAMLGGLLLGAAQEELCARLGGPVPRRRYEARADLLGARAERWPADAGAPGDCWALGVLLYRQLTGHGPYPEDDLPTLLAAVRDGRRYPADGCGPLRGLVEELLDLGPAARPTAADVQRRLRELLAAAPEPFGPADGEASPLLPVARPAGPVVAHPRGRRGERHLPVPRGPSRVPPALLGPLLVGGVLLALVAGLAAVVLVAG